MNPDPSGLYYADPGNPQSFNLYNYVLNNPLSFVDPSGRNCDDDNGNVTGTSTSGDSSTGVTTTVDVSGDCYEGGLVWYCGEYGGCGQNGPNPQPAPAQPPAPNNTAKKLACAAKYGQAHSIGSLFGGGTIANFLGGNSVSSLVNLGLSVTGNQPLSSGPYLTGLGLGLPVNDVLRLTGGQTNPFYGSAAGTIRSTALQSVFNAATESGAISSIAAEGGELAVQGGLTAGEFASGVGIAKFGLDALTFGYGYFFGCPD
jgi:uncharacterized protein RhaS with RHS repeats